MMLEPDFKLIVVEGDTIRIVSSSGGARRTAHLNLADHEGASLSIQGHSVGGRDGETLVIETTHFSGQSRPVEDREHDLRLFGTPLSFGLERAKRDGAETFEQPPTSSFNDEAALRTER